MSCFNEPRLSGEFNEPVKEKLGDGSLRYNLSRTPVKPAAGSDWGVVVSGIFALESGLEGVCFLDCLRFFLLAFGSCLVALFGFPEPSIPFLVVRLSGAKTAAMGVVSLVAITVWLVVGVTVWLVVGVLDSDKTIGLFVSEEAVYGCFSS